MNEFPCRVAEPEEGSPVGGLQIVAARLHLHPRQGRGASGHGTSASRGRAQEKQAREANKAAMSEGGYFHLLSRLERRKGAKWPTGVGYIGISDQCGVNGVWAFCAVRVLL